MMRIAFFVTYFPKMSEVFLLNQALALLDRGHDVVFYALADPGEGLRQPGADRLLDGRAHVGRQPGGSWARFRDLPRLLRRIRLRDTLAAMNVRRYGAEAASLRNLYRLDAVPGPIECDVAHAQFGQVARQCLLLRRIGLLRAPFVASFRGHDLSGYLHRAARGVYTEVFRESRACLPVSERWVERLVSLGCPRAKIHVVPSGVPMERVPRRSKGRAPGKGPPVLFSAARLERYKGLHIGIEAFGRIAAGIPEARYEIFGDGPEREHLHARARALGIADRIKWHGATIHPQLLEALERCHLHLFTTIRSPEGRTEGVPNILKETQAAGLPAVAFAHPGVDEVVEHERTGFIVPEGDAAAMSAAALRLLSDPTLTESFGSAAQKAARARFDLAAITDRLETIYSRAMEHAG